MMIEAPDIGTRKVACCYPESNCWDCHWHHWPRPTWMTASPRGRGWSPPSAGRTSCWTRRGGSSSAGRWWARPAGCSPSAPAFCQKHNFPPAFYIKCSRLWISNFNQVHWNDLPLRHHTKNFNGIFWRLSQMKWKSVYHLGSPGGGQAGCAISLPPMSPQPPPMSSQQAT